MCQTTESELNLFTTTLLQQNQSIRKHKTPSISSHSTSCPLICIYFAPSNLDWNMGEITFSHQSRKNRKSWSPPPPALIAESLGESGRVHDEQHCPWVQPSKGRRPSTSLSSRGPQLARVSLDDRPAIVQEVRTALGAAYESGRNAHLFKRPV